MVMPKRRDPKLRELPAKFEPGFMSRMDGRLAVAQKLQAGFNEIVSDLGGPDDLSHLKRSLAERATFLEHVIRVFECEYVEGKVAKDEIGSWVQATNALTGLAKTLGIDRKRISHGAQAVELMSGVDLFDALRQMDIEDGWVPTPEQDERYRRRRELRRIEERATNSTTAANAGP